MENIKFLKVIIVSLLVINGITIGSLWLHHPPGPPPPFQENGKHDVVSFLDDKLNLSDEQKQKLIQLKDEHISEVDFLMQKSKVLHQKFFDLLKTDDSNQSTLNLISDSISMIQKSLDMATYNHLKSIKGICNAEQQQKFNLILGDALHMMVPPHDKEHMEGNLPHPQTDMHPNAENNAPQLPVAATLFAPEIWFGSGPCGPNGNGGGDHDGDDHHGHGCGDDHHHHHELQDGGSGYNGSVFSPLFSNSNSQPCAFPKSTSDLTHFSNNINHVAQLNESAFIQLPVSSISNHFDLQITGNGFSEASFTGKWLNSLLPVFVNCIKQTVSAGLINQQCNANQIGTPHSMLIQSDHLIISKPIVIDQQ